MSSSDASRRVLGIDIGGTNLKALVVDETGAPLLEDLLPTDDRGDDSWRRNVRSLLDRVTTRLGSPPLAVGLAAPGLPARDQRSIAAMPGRLKGIEGFVWQDFLGTSRPVPVLNDAQAALLGECWTGAARNARNVVLITLGTGVGGAVLSEGRLLLGHIGRAGHLGHLSLDPDGAPDCTNTPGSLEDAIGGCTVARRSGGRFHTTADLVTAAAAGDATAREVWLRSVRALAAAIASFINLFDPEVVVIGGGVSRAGAALFNPLEELVRRFEWQACGHRVPIRPAQLLENAGALGAARAALNILSESD